MEASTKLINKNGLLISLKDFIKDSRQNIETKAISINSILKSMREENEKLILKSKLTKYHIILFSYKLL